MAGFWQSDFHSAVATKDADAMRRAAADGLPINEHVLGFSNEFTPLHYAIHEGGGAAVVGVLIAAGADVNEPAIKTGEENASPLCLAAQAGDIGVAKLLLAAGANVNYKDKHDVTPLSKSTREKKPGHEAVMKELLAAGAKSNYQALVGAARKGSPAMIEMLAASGADVNEVSRWGTALILAAFGKRVDTTEALLRVGADPRLRLPADHRNYPGQTALDVAKKQNASKVVRVLEAALAGKRPAAAPAKSAGDVPTLWKRVDKALKANRAGKPSLQKPATEAQIAGCEEALGVAFPPALQASFLVHNGQKAGADSLFPDEFANLDAAFSLLSLEDMVNEWRVWKKLVDAGEFAEQKGQPDAGIRPDWWNPKWLPFASDGGGDSLCIDLAPAKGGAVGQVIFHRHDAASRSIVAGDFPEFLQLFAEHLEELAAVKKLTRFKNTRPC